MPAPIFHWHDEEKKRLDAVFSTKEYLEGILFLVCLLLKSGLYCNYYVLFADNPSIEQQSGTYGIYLSSRPQQNYNTLFGESRYVNQKLDWHKQFALLAKGFVKKTSENSWKLHLINERNSPKKAGRKFCFQSLKL